MKCYRQVLKEAASDLRAESPCLPPASEYNTAHALRRASELVLWLCGFPFCVQGR